MLNKVLFFIAMGFFAVFGMGLSCGASIGHDHHSDAPRQHEWVAERNHVHTANCGHYNRDGHWYVADAGHVHGDGCGHHYRGGVWVLTD